MSTFTKRIAAAMLSVATLAPLGTAQAQSTFAPKSPVAAQRTVRGTQGTRKFMGRRHHKHRRTISQFRGTQQHHHRHHHA